MKSICEQRTAVVFPQFTGERHYMIPFTKKEGLPFDLRRWQPTVDAMLAGVDTDSSIYFMADQGFVRAGSTQRRPGLHIDGYWIPAIDAHGIPIRTPDKWDTGNWSIQKLDTNRHNTHNTHSKEWPDEALILASDVTASRALIGEWNADIGAGGDCKHVDTSNLREVILQAGHAYAGNVTMLHESLPVAFDCQRTIVRLNVPGWSPR